jgi:hypothetical protein
MSGRPRHVGVSSRRWWSHPVRRRARVRSTILTSSPTHRTVEPIGAQVSHSAEVRSVVDGGGVATRTRVPLHRGPPIPVTALTPFAETTACLAHLTPGPEHGATAAQRSAAPQLGRGHTRSPR